MERTRLFYDLSAFVNDKLKPKFISIIGRPPIELTPDVLIPQIMVSYGVLQDNRVLITFHVSVEADKEEELKIIVDNLTQLVEQESDASKFYVYDYGRTRVLHPEIDNKQFVQKLCHFAARPR